jgi:hypothetical protein
MKPAILSLAAGLLLAAPVLTGCAGEDAEAGEAAYPPVGYTPPAAAAADPPARPPPPPALSPAAQGPEDEQAPPASAQGAWQWAPPADDAAGDGPAGDPGEPPADDSGGYADTDPSALSDFRSTLEPYGTWSDDPSYGTVWVPSSSVVGSDFTPYVSAGHWAYDSDYAWVSDYDWGWAPFHYGRWVYAAGPGWEWVPGREYAGAWVSWRYGVDDWAYVGWAPLAPTWCWRGGRAVGIGFVPRAPYAFVGTGELFSPRIGGRVVAGAQVGVIASHTQPYVPASSPGGSRVAARPVVGGPSPAMLHLPADAVAHVASDNRGLTQARAFSHPTTAVALGARAPVGVAARSAPGAFSRGGEPVTAYRSQAMASPSQASHFGGRRLGGGFAGSAAASAPMRSPYPSYGGSPRPYFGQSSQSAAFRGSSPQFRSYSGPSTVRSAPSVGAFQSAPSSGGFRSAPSAGGFRSAPSASSFHGAPSGGFHGGGGGGGFHGGGGGHAGGHR